MILRPVKPVSPLRAAHDESACRINKKLGGAVDHRLREHLADDFFDAEFFDLLVINFLGVLGGDNHVRNADRLTVLVNHGDLGLRVGPEPLRLAALANPSQLAAEPMREHDRRRHQFRRVVARETKHQTLIARPLLRRFLPLGSLRVHALGNIRRLARDDVLHEKAIGVENVVIVDIADLAHGIAHDLDVIESRLRCDLTADDDDVAFGVSLAGHPALAVLPQASVEHSIGNGVANFIRMAFAYGFGSKNEASEHETKKGSGFRFPVQKSGAVQTET